MPKQGSIPGSGDFQTLISNMRTMADDGTICSLLRLTARVQVWDEQFGKGDVTASAAKLAEAALELLESPRDLNEAADILIVLLAWLKPAGYTLTDLINAASMKQIVNEQRHWEQDRLFAELPEYLAKMALFKVNTGCRDQEVCNLRWDWEIQIPELQTSIFIIPAQIVKNRNDRLVVLNRIAMSVVNEVRGQHPTHVFSRAGTPVKQMYVTKGTRFEEDLKERRIWVPNK